MADTKGFISSVLTGAVSVQRKTGLPAAVLIAQAILETGWGEHVTKDKNTGRFSYNLFNIKGIGTAGSVLATTFEYISGRRITIDDRFRAYNSYEESFADYAALITGNKTYARAVAARSDPANYARTLQACGYATDPGYADQLIALMNQYDLIEEVNFLAEVPQWKKEAMEWLFQKGYISQEHDPLETWDAATFAAVLKNAFQGETLDDWAKEAWQKAVSKGIVDGTMPRGILTREMLVVILDRLKLI